MIPIKQIEDDNFLLKHASAELSKHYRLCFQETGVPVYYVGGLIVPSIPSNELSYEEESLLDSLLLAQWEDRMWKGCFKYDVTMSEIMVVQGKQKFITQLSEGWSEAYPPKQGENKAFHQGNFSRMDLMQLTDEMLFCISKSPKAKSELIPSSTVPNDALLVILNETPVDYGHVFLVPFSISNHSVLLNGTSLEMVLRVAVEINNCSFRLLYDCSRPFDSPLYFEACYFPNPFAVELKPINVFFVEEQSGLHIYDVLKYPVKTLLFTTNNFRIMAYILSEACSRLLEANIAYNILISDCGKKVYLFLQRQMHENSTLSTLECGGYFLFNSRHEFNQVTEDAIYDRLHGASLDNEEFEAVKELCRRSASSFTM